MWYCNQLFAGISHITARSFSSAWNYCLKRGVSLWREVGCEGLGSVCGTTLSAKKKKEIIWLSKSLSVCASVMLTDSSQHDILPHTSGNCGGGEGLNNRPRIRSPPCVHLNIFQVLFTSLPVTVQYHMTGCLFYRCPPCIMGKWVINKPWNAIKCLLTAPLSFEKNDKFIWAIQKFSCCVQRKKQKKNHRGTSTEQTHFEFSSVMLISLFPFHAWKLVTN